MKRLVLALFLVSLPLRTWAQETSTSQPYTPPEPARVGSAAGYTTRDRTVLVMFGATVLIVVGVAVAASLIDSNNSH